MDCKESLEMMSAYVDNELAASDAIRVASHVAGCAECAAVHDGMRFSKAVVAGHAARHQAPAHLRHRIQTMIDREKSAGRKRKKFSWAWINAGAAAAFSTAFAFTFLLYVNTPSEAERFDQEVVADHYRSLMADHLTDVESSDRHTVKPWFTGKLDFSPPVHDLAQQGFPLVGGRLDYLNHRTAAALAYRHGKHFINLFVLPDSANRNAPPESRTMQGFHLLHWTRSGMAYWAVSDMGTEEMSEFQRLLASQPD